VEDRQERRLAGEDTLCRMSGGTAHAFSSRGLRERAAWLLTAVALPWLVEAFALITGRPLHELGILPREWSGLRGVLLAPLVHEGPEHRALNTVPLLVLGWLVLLRGPGVFLRLTLLVPVVGGGLVWACGRAHFHHVGSSGIVFGYFGYLVGTGFLERSWSSLLVAAVTVVLYGGVLVGVLPGVPEVSWESHLAGLVAGVAGAWVLAAPPRRPASPQSP